MQPVQCTGQVDVQHDREDMNRDTLQRSLSVLVSRLEAPAPQQAALVSRRQHGAVQNLDYAATMQFAAMLTMMTFRMSKR